MPQVIYAPVATDLEPYNGLPFNFTVILCSYPFCWPSLPAFYY